MKGKTGLTGHKTLVGHVATITTRTSRMSRRRRSCSWLVLCFAVASAAQSPQSPVPRVVDLKAPEGTLLKVSLPGATFRDCMDCPEMVVVPAGNFTMGSSASEKSWAASHGGSLESVADESPQHVVSLPSFALGNHKVSCPSRTGSQTTSFIEVGRLVP